MILKKLISILLLISSIHIFSKGSITFTLNGGRLGDNLKTYCKAKWISYTQGLKLYCPTFEHINKLMISSIETTYPPYQLYKLKQNKQLRVIDFYTPAQFNLITTCKNNLKFKNILRKCIAPKDKNFKHNLNSKYINIAVHYRSGSAHDPTVSSLQLYNYPINTTKYYFSHFFSDKIWPGKFIPLQWYIDQTYKLCKKLKNKEICINIFTDSRNPKFVTNAFNRKINLKNVKIKLQRGSITEDLFNMAACDILIRPNNSHYSLIAHAIGKHKLIYYPAKFKWQNNILYVTQVQQDGSIESLLKTKA